MSDLAGIGFSRPVPLRSLERGCPGIPAEGGVYAVVQDDAQPTFKSESVGGNFKGRNPSVPIEQLRAKWVDGSSILYIGKAKSLRKRIDQFAKFGRGEPIGHWGGRYLWQLANPDELQIVYRVDPKPADAEAILVSDFIETYGTLPFANLNRPRKTGIEK